MKNFIARHAARITSTLSGFDRLVFRGTLLPLMAPGGMFSFLTRAGVRLLDFKDYAKETSEQVKEVALAEAEKQGRPVEYSSRPRRAQRSSPGNCSRSTRFPARDSSAR